MELGLADREVTDEIARAVVDSFLEEGEEDPDYVAKLVAAWREFDAAARDTLDAFEE